MKPEQMYEFVAKRVTKKNLTMGMKAGVILGVTLLVVYLILLIGQYFYFLAQFRNLDPSEAKKIGNWEMPDSNYGLNNFGQMVIDEQTIDTAEIWDKKSRNKIRVFKTLFEDSGFLRAKDERLAKILDEYSLGGYYLKKSEKIEKYGLEIIYHIVGWKKTVGSREGSIGSLDCQTKEGNINTVFFIATNDSGSYDNDRVLEFINTFDCGEDTGVIQEEYKNMDKIDTDKDGLTDKVEKMLKTNPFSKDTDEDGYDDFSELKNSYSPIVARPFEIKMTPEQINKIKNDIRFVSEEVYRKIYESN